MERKLVDSPSHMLNAFKEFSDSIRTNDVCVGCVNISLQGYDLYGNAGVQGWYPLQTKTTLKEDVIEYSTIPNTNFGGFSPENNLKNRGLNFIQVLVAVKRNSEL